MPSVRASASLPPASPTADSPQKAGEGGASGGDAVADTEAARRVAWIRYHLKLGQYDEATAIGWDGAP